MIEKILPAGVAAAEAFDDPPGTALFPGEEAAIRHAVDKRRREFITVRHCARRALGELGVPPGPILRGERGAPRWPAGIVGSMTHCDGYRAAAVAPADRADAIGIDAEPHAPLPEGVLGTVALPAERERLRRLAVVVPAVHWDRLLFSAKESVYKAWFPLTGRWLGFEEADVDLRPDGTFAARILVAATAADGTPINGFAGRWLAAGGLTVTAIAWSGAPGRRPAPASSH